MAKWLAAVAVIAVASIISGDFAHGSPENFDRGRGSRALSLCAQLVLPAGYPCSDHTVLRSVVFFVRIPFFFWVGVK